jgi:hypothetical protein
MRLTINVPIVKVTAAGWRRLKAKADRTVDAAAYRHVVGARVREILSFFGNK